MYGGASKPESYCKITVYLQHNAPLLYENIQDLCLFGAFNTRGSGGVTFLLPDKKTQEKIDKLVGKDARKAVAMINACVLPVYLESIDDFRKHQEDIPNKLGNKLPIKEVTSSSVELSNGSKITRDGKFKRLYDNSNVAVYSIDGEVPTTGEASQELSKKKKGATGGDYLGGGDNFDYTRGEKRGTLNTQMAEEAYTLAILKTGNNSGGIDHLTHLGVSLLRWMVYGTTSSASMNNLGLLLCAVHPISPLYYLFCILLLDESDIKRWLSEKNHGYKNKTELIKLVNGGGVDRSDRYKNIIALKMDGSIASMDAKNICTEIINNAHKMMTTLGDRDYKPFGDEEGVGFRNWICSVSEFTFLYTAPYCKAWENGDAKTMKLIMNTYKTYILGCGGEWDKALVLINPHMDDILISSKERFCTILSLYVSNRFFPTGGNLVDLSKLDKNCEHGGVLYGDSLAPNTIRPTSNEHTTAKFWMNTVDDDGDDTV
jgi:hypothetical protein